MDKSYITSVEGPVRWAIQPPPTSFGVHNGRQVLQNKPADWRTVATTRRAAMDIVEGLTGKAWKQLYRQGYRASRVSLFLFNPSKRRPRRGTKKWIERTHPHLVDVSNAGPHS